MDTGNEIVRQLHNLLCLCEAAISRLAQLAERGTVNPEAIGSIPIAREITFALRKYTTMANPIQYYQSTHSSCRNIPHFNHLINQLHPRNIVIIVIPNLTALCHSFYKLIHGFLSIYHFCLPKLIPHTYKQSHFTALSFQLYYNTSSSHSLGQKSTKTTRNFANITIHTAALDKWELKEFNSHFQTKLHRIHSAYSS
jgi:hypothetical protein